MSSRARTAASGVLSFTFLDVLMCTMGSLLLLLTVLAKRAELGMLAGATATAQAPQVRATDAPTTAGARPSQSQSASSTATPTDEERVKALTANLAEMRRVKQLTESDLAQAAEAQAQEQARLAHLEEHERRLQHELAQLHIAMLRLKETEQRGFVDQQQADAEAARLEGLVRDAEQAIEQARQEASAKRSYAIVPYKGKNGTFRRPIYIECTGKAITIQPEGIRFTGADFDFQDGAGNPLMASIRAAQEELDRRATKAGAELPNAYPLLVVRPSGSESYYFAMSVVNQWNSDFGYQFVEEDWMLHYEEPDSGLAQVMQHAALDARQRQQMLAQMAPGRYSASAGRGAGGGGGRKSSPRSAYPARSGGGPQVVNRSGTVPRAATQPERRYGEITGEKPPEELTQEEFAAQIAAEEEKSSDAIGANAPVQNAASRSVKGNDDGRRPPNWANMAAATRKSSPVTRPIRVTIRRSGILVIPSDPNDPTSFAGATISFDQTTDRVLDAFAGAIQQQVDDWGAAGMGMYWRPTLIFDVAPGAELHAQRLNKLMANSGIDVRMPLGLQTAQGKAEEARR